MGGDRHGGSADAGGVTMSGDNGRDVLTVSMEALNFIVNDAEPGEDARLTVKGYNMACAALNRIASPVATINAELLEALKSTVNWAYSQDCIPIDGRNFGLSKANEAIAKAEGRTTHG